MKIKELDDELGKGIGGYLDGRFFEVRNQAGFQSRIYGNNESSNAIVLVEHKNSEKAYHYFKVLTDRVNYLFEVNIRNKKENFIRYLDRGFEKEFRSGKVKINPQQKGGGELRKYVSRRVIKYGVLAEALGWIAIIASTYSNPKITAVIAGFYFVFGDVICGAIIPWLADWGRFTSPFFQIGAYPLEKYFFKKYAALDLSLLAHFRKKSAKLKKLEEEFDTASDVGRKSILSHHLIRESEKIAREWEPVVLSFAKSEDLKAVIVGYKGTYQSSFAFSNYLVNGTEPKEEDLDIWRVEIKEPREIGEEADFDRVWEEKKVEEEEGKEAEEREKVEKKEENAEEEKEEEKEERVKEKKEEETGEGKENKGSEKKKTNE